MTRSHCKCFGLVLRLYVQRVRPACSHLRSVRVTRCCLFASSGASQNANLNRCTQGVSDPLSHRQYIADKHLTPKMFLLQTSIAFSIPTKSHITVNKAKEAIIVQCPLLSICNCVLAGRCADGRATNLPTITDGICPLLLVCFEIVGHARISDQL